MEPTEGATGSSLGLVGDEEVRVERMRGAFSRRLEGGKGGRAVREEEGRKREEVVGAGVIRVREGGRGGGGGTEGSC